jgi:hypothetical protein
LLAGGAKDNEEFGHDDREVLVQLVELMELVTTVNVGCEM